MSEGTRNAFAVETLTIPDSPRMDVSPKTITFNATGRTYVEGKMGLDGAEFLVWTIDELSANENSSLETGESTTASYRPYLEITFTPPSRLMMIRR